MADLRKHIRTGDDPILKQVCAEVLPGDSIDFMDLMERIVRKGHIAVGLAGPQIGVAKRGIFIMATVNGTVRGERMFNPVILGYSPTKSIETEGCLSYPNVPAKKIARHDWIRLRYQKHPAENPVDAKLTGFRARVAQHEIDHLDGICKVGDPNYLPDWGKEDDERVDRAIASARKASVAVASVLAAGFTGRL